MDKDKLKALLWQGHFWMQLIVFCCSEALAVGIFPVDSQAHKLLVGAIGVLGMYGYTAAAAWQAPRKAWTPEERAARGLPPK